MKKIIGPLIFLFCIGLISYSLRLGAVSGGSMEPALHEGSRIVFDVLGYQLFGLRKGDIIVFTNPHDTKQVDIKRIEGLPGEKVELSDGSGFVMQLGPEDYFVLGDNRNRSTDSRSFGAVQPVNIIGRVLFSF